MGEKENRNGEGAQAKKCSTPDWILQWDDFGVEIGWGYPLHQTCWGVVCRLIILCLTLIYFSQRIIVMKEYKASDVKKMMEEGAFDSSAVFQDDDFSVAIGVELSIGEAVDYKFSDFIEIEFEYGGNPRAADPEETVSFTKCSKADLGIVPGGTSKLYPLPAETAKLLASFEAEWFCPNLKGQKMYGNFLQDNYRSLYIDFNEKDDVCKTKNQAGGCNVFYSQAEIRAILSEYEIIILQNTQRFDTEDYTNSPPVVKEARFQLLDMPSSPQELRKFIIRSKMELDDNQFISINGLTQVEHEYWEVELEGRIRPGKKTSSLFVINYELSSDQRADSRVVYTFFDVLGDAGGLMALIASLAAIFLHFINFQKAENSLAGELYRPAPAKGDESEQEEDPRPEGQYSLKEWCQSVTPTRCLPRCCRLRRRDRYYQEARERLGEELEVVKLLQRIRLLEKALGADALAQVKQTSGEHELVGEGAPAAGHQQVAPASGIHSRTDTSSQPLADAPDKTPDL